MSVYIDDMEAPFGRMKMCHMLADTSDELHAMADAIGVARRWCQHPGTAREHYDVALSMKRKAIKLGAIAVTWRQMGTFSLARRRAWPTPVRFADVDVDAEPEL